jgi:hypothetical protein
MERLPYEIIINHIIPFTYNIQPTHLLQDIKNYYTIKSNLTNNEYDTNIIKHELIANLNINNQQFNNILNRHFQLHSKNYNKNIMNKYSLNTKFNIIFGLLSIQERIYFSEYIFSELNPWIIL